MNQVKFSFCVPHFNNPSLLRRCLESIKKFAYCYEVIVVDDCSHEQSKSLAKKYCQALGKEFLFYANKKNMGVTFTKNKCFCRAQGEWIIFIDCDDYFIPQLGRKMLEELESDLATAQPIIMYHCWDPSCDSRPEGRYVSLQEYLSVGTGEEALTVINKKLYNRSPYYAQLRGYEGLGIAAILKKTRSRIYVSQFRPRVYTSDSEIQLSKGKGFIRRLKKLGIGHKIFLTLYWNDISVRRKIKLILLTICYLGGGTLVRWKDNLV